MSTCKKLLLKCSPWIFSCRHFKFKLSTVFKTRYNPFSVHSVLNCNWYLVKIYAVFRISTFCWYIIYSSMLYNSFVPNKTCCVLCTHPNNLCITGSSFQNVMFSGSCRCSLTMVMLILFVLQCLAEKVCGYLSGVCLKENDSLSL